MDMEPAFRATSIDHTHQALETCPYCDQPIPNDRAEEIHERFDAAQRRQTAELKARMEAEMAAQRSQFEEAKKAEIAKIQQENAAALEKQKAEAQMQQAASLEEGKKLADAALRQQIETMVADRETAKSKIAEVEAQKNKAESDLATLKAQQDATIGERTAEVRAAMEKSKAEEINGLKAQHNAEAQKWSEQMEALQRRVDTAEGEGADVKLLEILKAKYPKDEFKSVNKASGADLVHVIKQNGKTCGKITYDTRNRNAWNPAFATNLRNDMVTEGANHAILTSSKFPSGEKQLCCQDGVLVANPARVPALAEILRAEVIRGHAQRISAEDRGRKTEILYDYITSDAFGKLADSVAGSYEKLLKLEEEEKRAHDAIWKKRGNLIASSLQSQTKLREQIDEIIGASDTE